MIWESNLQAVQAPAVSIGMLKPFGPLGPKYQAGQLLVDKPLIQ